MGLGTDADVHGAGYYVYVYTDAPNGTRYVVINRSNSVVELQSASATTAIQTALTLAAADGGAPVELGSGTFPVTALTYYTTTRLFGAGHGLSKLDQIAGSTGVLLSPASTAAAMDHVTIEDLWFDGFYAEGSGGGILISRVNGAHIAHCRFNYMNGYAIKVLGGSWTGGQDQDPTIVFNHFQNMRGATDPMVWLACGSVSKPDGALVSGNRYSSSGKFVKLSGDVSGDTIDGCAVHSNRGVGAAVALDIEADNCWFAYNRFEVTSGDLAVTCVSTSRRLSFLNNQYSVTGGGAFTFTDVAAPHGSTRWNEWETGSLVAVSGPQNSGALERVQGWVVFGSGTVNLGTIPFKAYVTAIRIQVTVAFNATVSNTISVGKTGTVDHWASATDVTSTGIKSPTAANLGYVSSAAGLTATATYAQSGTAATTGKALVIVEYFRVDAQP